MKVIVTQLLLGILFIVNGIVHHRSTGTNIFVSETVTKNLTKDKLPVYLKKVGKVYIFLGILVVTMGQIEYRYNPDQTLFYTTYIILGLASLSTLFYSNKKYTGYYISRL